MVGITHIGQGMKMVARRAVNVPAQLGPMAWYMSTVKRGKTGVSCWGRVKSLAALTDTEDGAHDRATGQDRRGHHEIGVDKVVLR